MKIRNYYRDLGKSTAILSVKQGLTLVIPFLILGSFALLFKSFPYPPYQEFITAFLGGRILNILDAVYTITLGSLALLLTVTISLSFGRMSESNEAFYYAVTALVSYMAFCGGIMENEEYIFGPEWVFTAMCITMLSCALFRLSVRAARKFEAMHTVGAEYLFNLSILNLLPIVIITLLFAGAGVLLREWTGASNITNFGSFLSMKAFRHLSGNLSGALLYVFFSHVLWFFGIHGTNTLDAVAKRLFEPGVSVNQTLIAAGKMPTEIYSKSFMDIFVFIGGCGAALCLITALLIAAKKSHNRKLGKVAGISVLFNISEIAIFGFPVIFNPVMFVPFILTPLVFVLTSTFAMTMGLVPYVTRSVEWTVPVIFSGYEATGSVAGSVLQIVNLLIGTLIYFPFIRYSEEKQTRNFKEEVRQMTEDMDQGDESGRRPILLSDDYIHSYAAKTLAYDLKNELERGCLTLHYQVQMSADGGIYGAEALLRWNHPVAGYIAPPLIIQLASESGQLQALGNFILEKACTDIQKMNRVSDQSLRVSVNISPSQLEQKDWSRHVLDLLSHYDFGKKQMVFEFTERVFLDHSEKVTGELENIRRNGIEISMDDFGMGHGSMVYLQDYFFEEVKLDGRLVRQLVDNERSRNIVSGIVDMAQTLKFHVVAEFVETEEQRDLLKEMGCKVFQGYYYGRPVPPEEFIKTYL